MNYIASIFLGYAILGFCPGMLINYFRHLIPDTFVQVFRFGRANVSKRGGSLKKIEIPKRWFWHFYLWAVLVQAYVVITVLKEYLAADLSSDNNDWLSKTVIIATGWSNQSSTVSATATAIAVILFQIQLTRRLLETLFVSVFSGNKMNIGHYITGYTHYTCAILALISSSPGFTTNMSESSKDFSISFGDLALEHFLGIFLFFFGNYHQYKAHRIFADLRKRNDKSISTMEHKIPVGGLFEYISCPNYFAEMVIYVGFAFLLGFKNYTWNCCTVWVVANQITGGIMNHQWYLEKFRDQYPKNRKAIIPYIW